MAVLRLAALLALICGCSPRGDAQAPPKQELPAALAHASEATPGPVEAEMRHVLYHVDDKVVLQIDYLRGALLPTTKAPPWFDDPTSFRIAIDSGEVEISPASLTALLNRYVFNYDGTPLTSRDTTYAGSLPDRILVFRNPTLRMCISEEEVVEEVGITVVHEIAHHFGIDDDRLHALGYA